MQIIRDKFIKWANWILLMVKRREGKVHPVSIVPSPFRAMQHMNDKRNLPGNVTSKLYRVGQVRKNNVESYYTRSLDSASDFKSPYSHDS